MVATHRINITPRNDYEECRTAYNTESLNYRQAKRDNEELRAELEHKLHSKIASELCHVYPVGVISMVDHNRTNPHLVLTKNNNLVGFLGHCYNCWCG